MYYFIIFILTILCFRDEIKFLFYKIYEKYSSTPLGIKIQREFEKYSSTPLGIKIQREFEKKYKYLNLKLMSIPRPNRISVSTCIFALCVEFFISYLTQDLPFCEFLHERIFSLFFLILKIIGYFSVLEQFSIVKFPLTLNFFYGNIYFSYIQSVFYTQVIYNNIRIIRYFRRIFDVIQSFFLPNIFSTKNYVYARIMVFSIKIYFRLFSKHKLLLFWRCNFQVFKVKIQLKFQEIVKTNFGHHYPFYTRLLNFYPYFLVIFFSILFHNFNGLLFYGSLILLFYYKILYYLFNL